MVNLVGRRGREKDGKSGGSNGLDGCWVMGELESRRRRWTKGDTTEGACG